MSEQSKSEQWESDFLQSEHAPPMENGEVYFAEPWQGRLFGMAHELVTQQVFSWDEFRECLIAQIADWERSSTGAYQYFDHFQSALEKLLQTKGQLDVSALTQRSKELGERPHGHDH